MKAERKIDYRHIICILITLGFVVLGIFRFFGCIGRIIESVRDCGLSVAYYFCEIFEIPHRITLTVNELPKIPFLISVANARRSHCSHRSVRSYSR